MPGTTRSLYLVKNETDGQTPPLRFSYSQLASFLPRLFEFVRTILRTPAEVNWLVRGTKSDAAFWRTKTGTNVRTGANHFQIDPVDAFAKIDARVSRG